MLSNHTPSVRAQFTHRRTYLRPLNEEGTRFETVDEAMSRVVGHQRWLWERQLGRDLNTEESAELDELEGLMRSAKVSMSGRVKWMGGTALVRERSAGAFNCSFSVAYTPADLVDIFWLLLNGCGVGFKPVTGLLSGFPSSIKKITVVPSTRTGRGGEENSSESIDMAAGTWRITFGDSAKGWAKALGMLFGEKPRVGELILDFSELRPGGKRLRGYGWISSGWQPLATALERIAGILQEAAHRPLTKGEIIDVVNFLGTVLSSRRSAQICLIETEASNLDELLTDLEWYIEFKTDRWQRGEGQREQSNNSIGFTRKPTAPVVSYLLKRILPTGEPGFVNVEHARRRAPEMEGLNPCAEILLPNKGFCNLVQVVWHRFNGDLAGLLRAQYLAGRANYRQTCVSMRDGVLQLQWNDAQKLLRLCGVSPTGAVAWDGIESPEMLEAARDAAVSGADSMADEFGAPRARRVTQVQPAGTSSKALGLEGDEVHEGAHLALSRWIFNWINFPSNDPMLGAFRAAGYDMKPNPNDPTGVIVCWPVEYPASSKFTAIDLVEGEHLEVNRESAISQLERYRLLMKHYVDHNCSITVSFDEAEIPAMVDWFMEHWDEYVGVSFLKRNNPLATAEELGFKYLPQECVSRERYEAYRRRLSPIDISEDKSAELLDQGECATGGCPIR
ncbi:MULTISPECIES: ribonucleoside-triphosphate reductase, adenosylcobalamin-dependent [Methylobacterium]|jgi:ribonucleoside-triphosphate reductase|uniref:Adenosylcobalamin-dependent ribonucleoside-triphosphate reductase n=4 Tax=Pseudomonadota TaxID=1224 RepID=A0ABQ4T2Y0_9HYPH|nr:MULTISPECIES: ribonucleoside-triphosphate reductase, adenosylcobalamin-dependent [Methylobacterium]PIU05268.1 MAG: ribonucleoside-triphosphate reductase, adenosylcobalamin-dependent [Methylobacterium sp. CG09_land_8_20_14_0_10_71_15]PIU12330.1 MAG: ribonucleoside-triphosphate reductase, adenosylcobalamin-dependent [Methylobacterium sp. CG08_land_8_20_14_0_20_71_15]GBU16834.1 ribonucleoside-triphosphate reductase, adenosylcobalamin-dependent [Methylobacterium sp.]GJE08379.1 Adenosylcobalamin-